MTENLTFARVGRRAVLKAALASAAAGAIGTSLPTAGAAPQGTSGRWPMFGYDARNTGHNPDPTDGVETDISTRWTLESGDRVNEQPTVADGVVYAGDWNGHIHALDVDDGSRIWSFDSGGDRAGPTALADGVVYATWSVHNPDERRLSALDADDGSQIWASQPADKIKGTPTVHEGTVYAASDTVLYALDAETGDRRWSFDPDERMRSPVAVNDGTLYAAGREKVYALDDIRSDDPTVRWSFDPADGIRSSVSVADGTVYVGERAGEYSERVFALDADDGSVRWTADVNSWNVSTPAVANGTVYFTGGHWVQAVRASDGEQLWEYHSDGFLGGGPVIVGETVYVGGDRGEFLAFDATDGSVRWSHPVDSWGVHSPAVVGNTIYVGAASEPYMYAIEGEGAEPETLAVDIDVKPGDESNRVNPNSRGNTPVAVLRTDDFDPSRVAVDTLRFGAPERVDAGGGATPMHAGGHAEDADGDGDEDLLLHFPTEGTGFDSDSERGKLVGETADGTPIEGSADIETAGNGVDYDGRGRRRRGRR